MTAIVELLASLPEEERIILTMHYIKGLSNIEIAEILGVPQRAVESVITSGKSRLLSALNEGQ
jgi:RNA polymerase sigma factor (sigma-70 family)